MRVLALVIALFLLVAGIWGFFSPVVLMFFTRQVRSAELLRGVSPQS